MTRLVVAWVCAGAILAGAPLSGAHQDPQPAPPSGPDEDVGLLEQLQGSPQIDAPLVDIEHRNWLSLGHRTSALRQIAGQDALSDGDVPRAARLYMEAVQADPGNGAAWRVIARIARSTGDRETEHDAWSYRLTLVPDDFEAIEALARHAVMRKDDRAATMMLLRRRLNEPQDDVMDGGRWNMALGAALARLGNHEAAAKYAGPAREDLLELAASEPMDRRARRRWSSLVQALVDEGSPKLVRELAETRLASGMLERPADRGRFASLVIVTDALLHDGSATLALFKSLPPDDIRLMTGHASPLPLAEALTHASNVHASLGNELAAVDLLVEAIKDDPNHALALNNLGYLLLERDPRNAQAPQLIERAWSLDPADPAILDSVGTLRAVQGRLSDDLDGPGALTLLRESSRLVDGLDPVVLEHLGDAEFAAGMPDAARRTWRQALALLESPRYRAQKLRTWSVIQQQDWGVRVMDPRELYDLELGDTIERLRGKLEGRGVARG